jgi:hypothetical protein
MYDPFNILLSIAASLGLSQEQTAVGIGIIAVIIGFSVISMVKGNIGAAIRLIGLGFALATFAVLSRVTGIISGL